jgi:phosphohistidine phosphatase
VSTLIVLRHGKSDWSGGEPDHLRPLARRGRRQAPEAGRWLAHNVAAIDLAVVSPAERTRETWRLAVLTTDVRYGVPAGR